MMKVRRGARVMVASAVLMLTPACVDDPIGPDDTSRRAAEEPFAFEVAGTGKKALVVQGITGVVRVEGSAAPGSVVVTGTRSTRARTTSEARAALRDLDVEIVDAGDVVLVRTVQPRDGRHVGYEVQYGISVPASLDVTVEQVTGPVVVGTLHGDVAVRNVTGSVTLLDTDGDADVRLVTGSIYAWLSLPPDGVADLSVTTGPVVAYIPTSTSARVRASVVTGTVAVRGLRLIDENPRPNVVTGTLNGGRGLLRLSTVTGAVAVVGR